MATTLFRPDFPSDEILTPLSAELDPGSYALVFGTGLFGATGEGAIHNGPDQPDIPPTELSSFIFFGIPNIGQPQIWRTNLASNMRFVIEANRQGDFDFDGNVDGRDVLTWHAIPAWVILPIGNRTTAWVPLLACPAVLCRSPQLGYCLSVGHYFSATVLVFAHGGLTNLLRILGCLSLGPC